MITPPPQYDPPSDPLILLHEDAHLLVLDKPSGLLSVPGRDPRHADSLSSRAEAAYEGARIVHRLDMDTSGVMVLARDAQTHRDLSKQFEARQVAKVYLARIAGAPECDEGEIDAPLICDWPNRPRQMVDRDNGKPALTRWRVLERGETSRIELRPQTGRTHQLRVHMAHIGCPILGDPFYAPDIWREAAPRLMLHAWTLGLHHPVTGDWLEFSADCPF